MNRNFKKPSLWILAFSLSFAPLVAQGYSGNGHRAQPVKPPVDPSTLPYTQPVTPPPAPPVVATQPAPAPASGPQASTTKVPASTPKKPSSGKKQPVPRIYNRKAEVDFSAPELAAPGAPSKTPLCNDVNDRRLYKKNGDHVIHKGYSAVQVCEQAVWQREGHTTKRPPFGQGKQATTVTPPAPATPDHDLSFIEINKLVMDFADVREGDNITGTVKIRGRMFKDCADLLVIEQLPKTLSTEDSCRKNAAGYVFRAISGLEECVKRHADAKDPCNNTEGNANQCVFLSQDGAKHKTSLSLATLPMGEVQIVRSNASGNEDHSILCESLPTPVEHITQSYVNECRAADTKAAVDRQLEIAQGRASCTPRNDEEFRLKSGACAWLAHAGFYSTAEECTKSLDAQGFAVLKNRVERAPNDELDDVLTGIIDWANQHPNECAKAVPLMQQIAKRHASRKSSAPRGTESEDGSTPVDGLGLAVDAFERAAIEAPCLAESSRFIEMQNNLIANRTLKVCQVGGVCSVECQTQYAEVVQSAFQSYSEACNGSGWQMDSSCTAAARNFQSTYSIPMLAYSNNLRTAQATQQLIAMASQGQSQGGAGGANGGGGVSGMPGMSSGMGGMNGTSQFVMPNSPSLNQVRPGSSGFGFGAL